MFDKIISKVKSINLINSEGKIKRVKDYIGGKISDGKSSDGKNSDKPPSVSSSSSISSSSKSVRSGGFTRKDLGAGNGLAGSISGKINNAKKLLSIDASGLVSENSIPSGPPTNSGYQGGESHSRTYSGSHSRAEGSLGHGSSSPIPLLGRYDTSTQFKIVGVVLFLALATGIGLTFWHANLNNTYASGFATSKELEMLSQRVSNSTQQSVIGNKESFAQLKNSQAQFNKDLTLLSSISNANNSSFAGEGLLNNYTNVDKVWKTKFQPKIEQILKQETNLLNLKQNEEKIRLIGGKLQSVMQEYVAFLATKGAPLSTQNIALQLYYDLGNFNFSNANQLLSTENPNTRAALQLSSNLKNFNSRLSSLVKGDPKLNLSVIDDADVLKRSGIAQSLMGDFEKSVSSILNNMEQLAQAKQAAREIFLSSEELLTSASKTSEAFDVAGGKVDSLVYGIAISGLIAILMAGLIILIFKKEGDSSRRAAREAFKNQANQESIDNLLNEMSGVAAGNLSTRLSVESDFTGSIAQTINQSVEALQRIVLRIKQTSQSVAGKTTEADKVAEEVLVYSQQQFDKLQEAVKIIGSMASNADEIAQLTFLVSEESNSSQQASRQGGEIVAQAIVRMDKMRETTQEAAKKIKRLGESSQSIGEAIILIQDITRQVNVLALNTAIHAASTGASGRAFGVVAQEVQRLASDSEEATRKIEALVATIQLDTNQAVAVMERTTQEVVEGTKLANSAGQALTKIDGLAGKVNEMVVTVNAKLDAQSSEFANMSLSMTKLGKLTESNMSGVRSAVSKVEEVKQEARLLEESVSDFKVD